MMLSRRLAAVLVAGSAVAVLGAPPPAEDALTEFSAGTWAADAQDAGADVFDDTARVQVGAAALRFETDAPFDAWLLAPAGQDADWDLLAAGSGGIGFWVYAENDSAFGFQNSSPWIRLVSGPGDYVELHATRELLTEAIGQWRWLDAPLTGNADWDVTHVGAPDLADVSHVEIHADTWDAGFTLWIDGLSFDRPLPPPSGLVAYAGNAQVAVSWNRYDATFGTFDHYAIYRDTSAFDDASALTPIATVADVDTTRFVDATALNGVRYHYAVTAVLTSGTETTDVSSVGPRTPWDETDLQVVSIARTPRYPRYDPTYSVYEITEPSGFGPYVFSAATGLGGGQDADTRRWPEVGDPVTYTATVRNRGTNEWSGALGGTWRLDGGVLDEPSQVVSLAPGETTTFAVMVPWDGASREVSFALDVTDDRAENDARAIDTRSVAFLSFADRTYAEDFREETPDYPGAVTDDLIDWLNDHMDRFNTMFADADCAKRVHFDVLELLDDDAADPDVERIDFAIFPFRYHAGDATLRHTGYYSAADDIDYGLLHEMGHQLGLIDLYQMNISPSQNQVSGDGYSATPGLMNGVSHFVSEHSAHAMNHWLDVAHGYYGQYLYGIPDEVRVRVLDADGTPLPDATVRVYQLVERPGQGKVITNEAKAQGLTDANGEYVLPNVPIDAGLVPPTFAGDVLPDNPFGYVAVVGTNGVLLLEIEYQGAAEHEWLGITEVNNAYYRGETEIAVFERATSLGGTLQYYPPADLAELNAGEWSSWAQDGDIAVVDDEAFAVAGAGSLRVEATGGFDNYVRYPGGQNARWDLSRTDSLSVWFYAENPNGGFQNASPWIRLRAADGYVELHPTYDILNNAIGQWVEFEIPLAGNGVWQRSQSGAPSLDAIHAIELHADTWGAGFTLWIDGLSFHPRPCQGDLDGNAAVDLADLSTLLTHFGTGSGAAPEDGDIDRDGDVDLQDLSLLLTAFGASCA